jgi:hypothetical protein
MSFNLRGGLVDCMAELARLDADIKRDPKSFWDGNGKTRMANWVKRAAALVQRLDEYERTHTNG